MNHYTYTDYKSGLPVFECQAKSLLEADKLLLDAKGIEAAKTSQIGCAIKFNHTENSNDQQS